MSKYIKTKGGWLEAVPTIKNRLAYLIAESFNKVGSSWAMTSGLTNGFTIDLTDSNASRTLTLNYANVNAAIEITHSPKIGTLNVVNSAPVASNGILNPIEVAVDLPNGGSLTINNGKGWSQTVNTIGSHILTIPAGSQSLTITGKGGTATSVTDPGRPYIAPSGPIYSTRDVWVPGKPAVYGLRWSKVALGSWITSPPGVINDGFGNPYRGPIEYMNFTSDTVYKVWNGTWDQLRVQTPASIQTKGHQNEYDAPKNVPNPNRKLRVHRARAEEYLVSAATNGYYTTETYQSGWSNQGQSYIAPVTTYTKGADVVVTIQGVTHTFLGGATGAASSSNKTQNVVTSNYGKKIITIPAGVKRLSFSNLEALNTAPELQFASNNIIARLSSLRGYGLTSYPRMSSSELIHVPLDLPSHITNVDFAFKDSIGFNQNLNSWEVKQVTSWKKFSNPSLLSVNIPGKFR